MTRTTSIRSPGSNWQQYILTGMIAVLGIAMLMALLVDSGSRLMSQGMTTPIPVSMMVPVLTALYVLPGLAMLRLLWPRTHPLPRVARWVLASGISVALPPLLLLLCAYLRLPWNAGVTWGYLLLAALFTCWPARPDGTGYTLRLRQGCWPWQGRTLLSGTEAALLIIATLLLLVRLHVVRDLPTGLYGDSYHHTMIAQLLADNGGLFESWQPYAPLTTMTYHFGFHANTAFVHWLTGMDVVQSVIWTGQIINALAVVIVFALTVALGGNNWAGVWAVALSGFVFQIPAYFVNWGRYTQLTGQVVLVTLLISWIWLSERVADQHGDSSRLRCLWLSVQRNWRLVILATLLTGAMILTHYQVTFLAALLVGSYLLTLVLVRRSGVVLVRVGLAALLVVVLVLTLTGPWLYNLFQGHLVRNTVSTVSNSNTGSHLAVLPAIVPRFSPAPVLGLAALGVLLAVWRRQWRIVLLAVWGVLLLLSEVPGIVGLPGGGIVNTLLTMGLLYVLIAPLAGYWLAGLLTGLHALQRRVPASSATGYTLTGIGLLIVVIAGIPVQTNVIEGDTQLVTHADMAAMQWIREHTQPDARFLVNSFPAYGGTLIAGNDAGWWLPLLTGRASTLPPITYGSEQSEDPSYARQVNALATALRGQPLTDLSAVQIDLTTSRALRMLRKANIDYVYIGARTSPGPGRADVIDVERLRQSSAFQISYQSKGVTIFQIRTETTRTQREES